MTSKFKYKLNIFEFWSICSTAIFKEDGRIRVRHKRPCCIFSTKYYASGCLATWCSILSSNLLYEIFNILFCFPDKWSVWKDCSTKHHASNAIMKTVPLFSRIAKSASTKGIIPIPSRAVNGSCHIGLLELWISRAQVWKGSFPFHLEL